MSLSAAAPKPSHCSLYWWFRYWCHASWQCRQGQGRWGSQLFLGNVQVPSFVHDTSDKCVNERGDMWSENLQDLLLESFVKDLIETCISCKWKEKKLLIISRKPYQSMLFLSEFGFWTQPAHCLQPWTQLCSATLQSGQLAAPGLFSIKASVSTRLFFSVI